VVSEVDVPLPSALRTGLHPVRRALHNPLLLVLLRRLALAVPLLFLVSAVSFVLVSLTPGDAAHNILGANQPESAYIKLRHQLGLDQPMYVRYWDWVREALHGNFGRSLVTGEAVTHAIDSRLPVTLSLIVGAILVTVVIGVGFGVFSAVRGGTVGRAVDAFALAGFSIPSFWIGFVLVGIFAVDLHWLPATGYVPLTQSAQDWFLSLLLPVAVLGLLTVATIAKQTREAMLDALSSEYVRMARASGVSPTSIVFRHALKNASMSVVTILGLYIVGLLSGTVVVENVFALPGLGGLAVTASIQHDLPTIEGIVVYFTVVVVFVNLAVDLAYTWLNPRVRVG
jgi:peptide/nickel transport system permease protein